MRFKSSYLVIAGVVAVVAIWLIIRPLLGGGERKAEAAPNGKGAPAAKAQKAAANTVPLVYVSQVAQEQHPYAVTLRGRTQAARTVVVRSETSGTVAQTPVLQGTFVRRGAVLCRLSVDARQAALDQARAMVKSRQLQMKASADLHAKGYRSETQMLGDQANMEAATAAARQAQVALSQVNIRAPFTGVFDRREAEIGTFLAPGQACGTMIELDPLLIVGDLPETQTGKLRLGSTAVAKLVSGEMVTGRVRFIARDADPTTRTYRVEITAPNPGGRVRSGLSAEVRVEAGAGPAHLVPVSALVLDAAGRQGVRYVLADNRVAFAAVSVVEETPTGVWVSGLSGPVRIITVGQSYVSEGQQVRVQGAAQVASR